MAENFRANASDNDSPNMTRSDEANGQNQIEYERHTFFYISSDEYRKLFGQENPANYCPNDGSRIPGANEAQMHRQRWQNNHPTIPGHMPHDADTYRRYWWNNHPDVRQPRYSPLDVRQPGCHDRYPSYAPRQYYPNVPIIDIPGTRGISPDGRAWPNGHPNGNPLCPPDHERFHYHPDGQPWNSLRRDLNYIPRISPQSLIPGLRSSINYNHREKEWSDLQHIIAPMIGQSINRYDRTVPASLGCASFVSIVLNKAYHLPIHEININGLEKQLPKYGFKAYSLSQIMPGDIIIGHRKPGHHGHAGIYLGDGQIVNNSSHQQKIVRGNLSQFQNVEYQSVKAYRRV